MIPPSAADLLLAWEWGLPSTVLERGVVLLAALQPEEAPERLADMSIGERDAALLRARRVLFGPELDCVMRCPGCGADLELKVAVNDLLGDGTSSAPAGAGTVDAAGWAVRFRLIAVRDLIEATGAPDPREALLRRCVVGTIAPDGAETGSVPDGGLPTEVELALLDEIERRDVLPPVDFALSCPECSHAWDAPFDPAGFLWAELEGWVQRTLREVHLLASAYGWSERDILAMSAWRRDAYLRMSGDG